MKDFPASLHFLMTCSLESLQSFETRRLDEAAHLLRKLVELTGDLTRAQVEAEMAHLILKERQLPSRPIHPPRPLQLPALTFRPPTLHPALLNGARLSHRLVTIPHPHTASPPACRPRFPLPSLLGHPLSLAFAT